MLRIITIFFVTLSVFFSSNCAFAQNKVVVVPLGEDLPAVNTLVLSRINVQCLDNIVNYAPTQEVTNFAVDDRQPENPIMKPILDGSAADELPAGTSVISVYVAAVSQDIGNGPQDLVGSVINVGGFQSPQAVSQEVYDCSDENTATAIPGASTTSEDDVLFATSMTGESWAIRSNHILRDGVVTLGPTVLTRESAPMMGVQMNPVEKSDRMIVDGKFFIRSH